MEPKDEHQKVVHRLLARGKGGKSDKKHVKHCATCQTLLEGKNKALLRAILGKDRITR